MVLAMFFISIMAVGTKWVGASYPVLQIVFIRNIFVLALVFYPAAPFLMQQGLNNAWENGTPGGAGGYGGEGF